MKQNPKLDALTMDLFRQLMAEDTVNPPGNEMRAAAILEKVFRDEGILCEVQDLGDNRANFIAQLGTGRPRLEFCGHLDVVPAAGEWRHTKIGATEEDGLLYGRGACDMKGGIAAMCAAAIWMHRNSLPGSDSLRLCFVADEECDNLGMHAFQNTREAACRTILGEPTDLHVAVAHRGAAREYIDLHGLSCHSALRPEGETAMTRAARAVLALDEMNQRLLSRKHPVLPPPSVAVTLVHGYVKDNVIPPVVRLMTDYRILPGTDSASARADVVSALEGAGITDFTLERCFYMPGGETDPDDPFVRICLETAAALNEREEKAEPFRASCEQCFLVEKGSRTVILGPGSLDQAHTADEYAEKKQLLRAAYLYMEIARHVAREGQEA